VNHGLIYQYFHQMVYAMLSTLADQEQFIMAYGGLRGAVGFSLVMMIDKTIVPSAGIFVTTTLAVVISTVFIQVAREGPGLAALQLTFQC
jgi:NhaP-type Na+/H+ or K+/H+ antiporter